MAPSILEPLAGGMMKKTFTASGIAAQSLVMPLVPWHFVSVCALRRNTVSHMIK